MFLPLSLDTPMLCGAALRVLTLQICSALLCLVQMCVISVANMTRCIWATHRSVRCSFVVVAGLQGSYSDRKVPDLFLMENYTIRSITTQFHFGSLHKATWNWCLGKKIQQTQSWKWNVIYIGYFSKLCFRQHLLYVNRGVCHASCRQFAWHPIPWKTFIYVILYCWPFP